MAELPAFFSSAVPMPEGMDSLIGELEEHNLLGATADDGEEDEINKETFGSVTMDEVHADLPDAEFFKQGADLSVGMTELELSGAAGGAAGAARAGRGQNKVTSLEDLEGPRTAPIPSVETVEAVRVPGQATPSPPWAASAAVASRPPPGPGLALARPLQQHPFPGAPGQVSQFPLPGAQYSMPGVQAVMAAGQSPPRGVPMTPQQMAQHQYNMQQVAAARGAPRGPAPPQPPRGMPLRGWGPAPRGLWNPATGNMGPPPGQPPPRPFVPPAYEPGREAWLNASVPEYGRQHPRGPPQQPIQSRGPHQDANGAGRGQPQRYYMRSPGSGYTGPGRPPSARPPPLIPAGVPTRGAMMTARDISFVLHVHLRALQISDPYNQDFYFHNLPIRRQARAAAAQAASRGSAESGALASGGAIPLPVWEETKQKAVADKQELRDKFSARTKEWATTNQTLGQVAKSDPHRQKSLLAGLDLLSASQSTDGPDGVEPAAPFSSILWKARRCIEEARAALLVIDEQRRLLRRDDRTPEQVERIQATLGSRFLALQQALGFSETNYETVEDVATLTAIVALPKGRKLVARVVRLVPSQAPALLPVVLRAMFSRLPVRPEMLEAAADVEQRQALVQLQESEDQLLAAFQEVIAQTGKLSYAIAKATIENVMAPHIRHETLNATLSIRPRAEIMSHVLKLGSESAGEEDGEYWRTLKAAFMGLAKRKGAGDVPTAQQA